MVGAHRKLLGSFDVCEGPGQLFLLEAVVRSFFAVLTTHILAGEVDTTLPEDDIFRKLSWLVRYFNPVNLCWRYYSILAYRCLSKNWEQRQLALINSESYPYKDPVPYIVGEKIAEYQVRRLEISGLWSSQGLLSILAAYQGILAVQFTLERQDIGYLHAIAKPMAILGLFRFMVSNWIASKVFVEPYPYPSEVADVEYRSNKLVSCVWFAVLLALLMLSIWPLVDDLELDFRKQYRRLSIIFLYQYVAVSTFLFHVVLLSKGPKGLANRIVYFDHWIYKLQTAVYVALLAGMVAAGLVDLIHDVFNRF